MLHTIGTQAACEVDYPGSLEDRESECIRALAWPGPANLVRAGGVFPESEELAAGCPMLEARLPVQPAPIEVLHGRSGPPPDERS